jgi:hypothetical protein
MVHDVATLVSYKLEVYVGKLSNRRRARGLEELLPRSTGNRSSHYARISSGDSRCATCCDGSANFARH